LNERPWTLDAEFARIDRDEIPGFGGYFLDKEGILNVYLTNPAGKDRAITTLAHLLKGQPPLRGSGGRSPDMSLTRVLQGQYGFAELRRWRIQTDQFIFSVPGVISTDIDETRNRLAIGVEDAPTARRVRTELAQRAIPTNVVIVELVEPFQFAARLDERVRPVKGGLGIQAPGGGGFCTLGFLARQTSGFYSSEPYPLFITNSHCTNIMGGVERTAFYQPSSAIFSDYIGEEIVDPPYNYPQNTLFCGEGASCRWSDSALGRFTAELGSTASFGKIARPYFPGTSSNPRIIDPDNPEFFITLDYSLESRKASDDGRFRDFAIHLPGEEEISATCCQIGTSGKVVNKAGSQVKLLSRELANS
jgi:hypothetical protein